MQSASWKHLIPIFETRNPFIGENSTSRIWTVLDSVRLWRDMKLLYMYIRISKYKKRRNKRMRRHENVIMAISSIHVSHDFVTILILSFLCYLFFRTPIRGEKGRKLCKLNLCKLWKSHIKYYGWLYKTQSRKFIFFNERPLYSV